MKKFLSLAAVAALSTSAFASDDLSAMKAELQALKSQVAELKKNQEGANLSELAGQVRELKTRTGGDNLKWDADYRVSYDVISTKSALGTEVDNGVLSNRLWLGMKAAPRKDISFIGQLAYNKGFGDTANHSQANTAPGYSNFDWIKNENLGDNAVSIKTLYAIYFGQIGNVDYTASIGRRASTNGTLANLRDDDAEASPNGHMINVEFDGASFNFLLDKVTGVPGMAFKLCMGRGLTNANVWGAQNAMGTNVAYMEDTTKNENIDMFGFIFTPYDNGQYRVTTQAFKAWNLIGFTPAAMGAYQAAYMAYAAAPSATTAFNLSAATPAFANVGNMYGATISAIATGVGSGLGDFADNTTLFASWSASKTNPQNGRSMLGSTLDKTGQSWWIGAQMPALVTKDGKIGVEYNTGSKYWRSFTYGEDTMVGSKLAARGKAYEVYYTQPILGKNLSAQVRYTHIDYDYTGSQGFFGAEGTPYDVDAVKAAGGMMGDAVKTASNIRAYLRYRY